MTEASWHVGTLALALSRRSGTGACASMGTPLDLRGEDQPGQVPDKTVTVEGVVTTSFGIPLVPFKVYRVSDGSDEMLVISDNSRIPGKNARVRVRGEVEEVRLIGGRSFGLHLREKSIKFSVRRLEAGSWGLGVHVPIRTQPRQWGIPTL